jgi:transposase
MLNTSPPPSAKPKPLPPARTRASTIKRKRGGQPGNLNARKDGAFSIHQPGPLSRLISKAKNLQFSFISGTQSLHEIVDQAQKTYVQLESARDQHKPSIAVLKIETGVLSLSVRAKTAIFYDRLRRQVLEVLAIDPLTVILIGFKNYGITRDADSFFPVSKLSARNSTDASLPSPNVPIWRGAGGGVEAGSQVEGGVPPDHPSLATNLTDEQWAVLAPLIPPDPAMDWLTGEPPVIIAANRWRYTCYSHIGKFKDLAIIQEYNRVLQRCPALLAPASPAKKRGRPRNAPISPRVLLDAIIWKLATGNTWDALPLGFPPMRLCRKYYRRLFLSGRLYTLLLALYNHMRFEAFIDPYVLLKLGIFTITPGQNIALSPGVPPIWQVYTALLFMQLARDAFLRLERENEHASGISCPPFLKGFDQLSTGRFPDSGQPKTPPIPTFQPLKKSPAYKKWKQIERVDREVAIRRVSVKRTSPRSATRVAERRGGHKPPSPRSATRVAGDPLPEEQPDE